MDIPETPREERRGARKDDGWVDINNNSARSIVHGLSRGYNFPISATDSDWFLVILLLLLVPQINDTL